MLDHRDEGLWGSGDELFPIVGLHDDGLHYVYYLPNGRGRRGSLGVGWGPASGPARFSRRVTSQDGRLIVWGMGGSARIAPRRHALFLNNVRRNCLEARIVDLHDPARLSAPVRAYQFPNMSQGTVYRDDSTGTWYLYYRFADNSAYGVRTASPGKAGPMMSDAISYFDGTVLIVAPHMDDEVLACGGLIARLPDKRRVHVVYATDGTKSPAPVPPWTGRVSDDLGKVRRSESETALGLLGVPRENLRFLDLPEADLSRHAGKLAGALREHLAWLQPDQMLAPFRYDRHPDHLAVNRVATAAYEERGRGRLFEYFVYYRWRLLPAGDIRSYIRPEHLLGVEIGSVAALKRAALDCFRSQTTRYYPWQTRPILTPMLLDEECRGPEVFLAYDAARRGPAVFTRAVPWIRVAHRVEPSLQRWKYYAKATLLRAVGGGA